MTKIFKSHIKKNHARLLIAVVCIVLSACGGGSPSNLETTINSGTGTDSGQGTSTPALGALYNQANIISVDASSKDFIYRNTDSTSSLNGFTIQIKAGGLSSNNGSLSIQTSKPANNLSDSYVKAGGIFVSNSYKILLSSGVIPTTPLAITLPYDNTLTKIQPVVFWLNPTTQKYEGVEVIGNN